MKLHILYEDNHVLAIYKPAGLLTQGDISEHANLLDLAKQYIKDKYNKPGKVYLGLLHRLDRNVSGIVLFARTSKSASRLSKQFREHTIEKQYLCLVENQMKVGDTKQLIHYLYKNSKTNQTKVYNKKTPLSKQAILNYTVIKQTPEYEKIFFSIKIINYQHQLVLERGLLTVNLLTGRSHQIRAQLAHIGHPIIGDTKYGSTTKLPNQAIALCAYKLTFTHPTTKETISLDLLK